MTRRELFFFFDRLPPEVREEVNNSRLCLSAEDIYGLYRVSRSMPAAEIVARIRQSVERKLASVQ